MGKVTVLRVCAAIAILALGSAVAAGQPKRMDAETTAKPLIIEKNEGELRVRRIPADSTAVPMSMPSSEFMLKVSPKNNGSQQLVLGTEEIAPGGRIRKHKHLRQDEILLIQTGTARVRVGDMEREVHAGGLVFLPRNMTIELQNIGSEPIALVFIFSTPGFEDYMRCVSVPASQERTTITSEELRRCAHAGHVVYAELQQPPNK
jgi:quercetin dioxygenase-like cupin family protein